VGECKTRPHPAPLPCLVRASLKKWSPQSFCIFFCLFLWFWRICTTLLVLISSLFDVSYLFTVLVRCLFDSGWKISFEKVHIQSMILKSSTLEIRRQEYSGALNIVLFEVIDTLPYYAINMDVVSFISNSSFSFFTSICTLSIWINEYRLFR